MATMSQTMPSTPADPSGARGRSSRAAGDSAWAGWVVFGGLMMPLLGGLHAVAGLVALFKEDYYQGGRQGLLVTMSWTAWGWTQIVVGLLLIAAGVELLLGQAWGRFVTVVVGLLSIVQSFVFASVAPFWAAIFIALAGVTVFAVITHGSELTGLG